MHTKGTFSKHLLEEKVSNKHPLIFICGLMMLSVAQTISIQQQDQQLMNSKEHEKSCHGIQDSNYHKTGLPTRLLTAWSMTRGMLVQCTASWRAKSQHIVDEDYATIPTFTCRD
jgi:hypothetical protein